MSHFDRFTATAAVLADANIDTDIIFPARFLLLLDREGLGEHAFEDRRLGSDGRENPDFILNQPAFRNSAILIAGPDFGCGSSREHAVWALHGRGIRCVIAPSFGEIFYANCFRNGLLPIVLPEDEVQRLRTHAASAAPITIDLSNQRVEFGDGLSITFDVAADQRDALLNGLDDIALILQNDLPVIQEYEHRRAASHPWLFL
jgi:3-isopropylmalate/(R)-2-methylmalate dehydratase small subunit